MKLTASQKAKADTSLNQIPALIKKHASDLGSVNLDWGGGKYNKTTDYLAERGVTNLVYDPYNRDIDHNREIILQAYSTAINTITCANVLNVLKSKAARTKLLKEIYGVVKYQYSKQYRWVTVYFSMYEKNGNGIPDENLPQTNMKTEDYRAEIAKVFGFTFATEIEMVGKVLRVRSRDIFVK